MPKPLNLRVGTPSLDTSYEDIRSRAFAPFAPVFTHAFAAALDTTLLRPCLEEGNVFGADGKCGKEEKGLFQPNSRLFLNKNKEETSKHIRRKGETERIKGAIRIGANRVNGWVCSRLGRRACVLRLRAVCSCKGCPSRPDDKGGNVGFPRILALADGRGGYACATITVEGRGDTNSAMSPPGLRYKVVLARQSRLGPFLVFSLSYCYLFVWSLPRLLSER